MRPERPIPTSKPSIFFGWSLRVMRPGRPGMPMSGSLPPSVAERCSSSVASQLFMIIDTDANGTIELHEFIAFFGLAMRVAWKTKNMRQLQVEAKLKKKERKEDKLRKRRMSNPDEMKDEAETVALQEQDHGMVDHRELDIPEEVIADAQAGGGSGLLDTTETSRELKRNTIKLTLKQLLSDLFFLHILKTGGTVKCERSQ